MSRSRRGPMCSDREGSAHTYSLSKYFRSLSQLSILAFQVKDFTKRYVHIRSINSRGRKNKVNPTPDRDFLEESEAWIQEKRWGCWGTWARWGMLGDSGQGGTHGCFSNIARSLLWHLCGSGTQLVLNSHPGAGNGSALLRL